MALKLLSLFMEWETIACVRTGQKCSQSPSNTHDITFSKKNSIVNLITLTTLPKRLTLDTWLGPGRASAYGYIKVFKIQIKMSKVGRQVKKESCLALVFLLLPI